MTTETHMTPFLNEAVVRDRLARHHEQAEQRRLARRARIGLLRRTDQHPIRDAVGQGLIALGTRLVDTPPNVDDPNLPKAA